MKRFIICIMLMLLLGCVQACSIIGQGEGCVTQNILTSDAEVINTQSADIDGEFFMAEKDSAYINNIDFKRYLKYIWITDEWSENRVSSPSFRIEKSDNYVLSGTFSSEPAIPEWFSEPDKYLEYDDNNLHGIIINGIAECMFDGNGKGSVRLEFIGKNSIEVEIKYLEKDVAYNNFEDGRFLYRPYNIKDHDLFVENKELEIETKLDSWGDVKIISGRQETNHAVPVIFLTDKDGNVFYRFGAPYQHDSSVKEVIIEDMNGDGLKDVKVITFFSYAPNMCEFVWNFYQLENGWFWMERAGDIP